MTYHDHRHAHRREIGAQFTPREQTVGLTDLDVSAEVGPSGYSAAVCALADR